MDPQIKLRRTLEAIKRIILRESLNQPLVVIFEDLHWIDSQTQELLDLLTESIANARMLLLFNYRPEYRHQWTNKSYYAQLRLDTLSEEGAAAMLSALLGEGVELAPLKRLVIERTEGNPFFIEEMVQALFDESALVRNGVVKVLGQLVMFPVAPDVFDRIEFRGARRLVEGYFELRDLGPTEVKGISEPINVYEVLGVGALRGHFELAARRGLTKFVGRER